MHYLCSEIQKPSIMNLNLTSTIKMPDHQLRRQVIDLCKKVEKPRLKLSTKDYVDNGLGHLVEEFDGQAGLVNIEVFNELQHTITGWPPLGYNARYARLISILSLQRSFLAG